MWAPKAMLIEPSELTVSAWQFAQDAASFAPASFGWPVGGMAWQEPQSSGVESFQVAMTRVPVTAPMVKFPWQETLLQVWVVRIEGSPRLVHRGVLREVDHEPGRGMTARAGDARAEDAALEVRPVVRAQRGEPRRVRSRLCIVTGDRRHGEEKNRENGTKSEHVHGPLL